MSEFKDRLWRELVREHGDELAQIRRPATKPSRRARPRVLAGTTVGLAGVGTVLALVLGATSSTPAFAVTRAPDGTVMLTIKQLAGITGANAKLEALGVRARAVPVVAGCTASPVVAGLMASAQAGHAPLLRAHRPRPALVSVRIYPSKIPAGETLVLAAKQSSRPYVTLLAQEMVRGAVPNCLGAPPPPPLPTPDRGSCHAIHTVPLRGRVPRPPDGFSAVQLNARTSASGTRRWGTGNGVAPAVSCRVGPPLAGNNGSSGSSGRTGK